MNTTWCELATRIMARLSQLLFSRLVPRVNPLWHRNRRNPLPKLHPLRDKRDVPNRQPGPFSLPQKKLQKHSRRVTQILGVLFKAMAYLGRKRRLWSWDHQQPSEKRCCKARIRTGGSSRVRFPNMKGEGKKRVPLL